MRRPSPDFTTALATRKATTTRSTLALAKPSKGLAGIDGASKHRSRYRQQRGRQEWKCVQNDSEDSRRKYGKEMPSSLSSARLVSARTKCRTPGRKTGLV